MFLTLAVLNHRVRKVRAVQFTPHTSEDQWLGAVLSERERRTVGGVWTLAAKGVKIAFSGQHKFFSL